MRTVARVMALSVLAVLAFSWPANAKHLRVLMSGNGTALVPAQFVAEFLGATCTETLDGPSEIRLDDRTVRFTPAKWEAAVNGKAVRMTGPAEMLDGVLHVPLPALAGGLLVKVEEPATVVHPTTGEALRLMPKRVEQEAYWCEALHIEALAGLQARVEARVKAGANIEEPDADGRTALHLVAAEGNARMVQCLIGLGARADARDGQRTTPLMLASEPTTLGLLVDAGADLHAADDRGWTPLHHAVSAGRRAQVDFLLAKGVAPRDADALGRTPIFYARTGSMVEVLINRGANLRERDREGRQPLHVMAAGDHNDAVWYAVTHGADVSGLDDAGRTPLFGAGYAAATSLLKMGAKTKLVDKQRRNAVFYAPDGVTVSYLVNVVGLQANATDLGGMTALHLASMDGRLDACQSLWLYVGHNARDKRGRTALHYAAERGRRDVVEWMLEQDCDPYVKDGEGRTPLDLATAAGHQAVIDLLGQ